MKPFSNLQQQTISQEMKRSFLFLIAILILLSCNKAFKGDIIIENINLIDVASGSIIPNQTIIISNNKIDTILNSDTDLKLQSDKIINGTGKYITPGLWDMHTHVLWTIPSYKLNNAMMITSGITGFRDMYGSDSIAHLAKNLFLSKDIPAQRMYRTNEMLDGFPPIWDYNAVVKNPEEAVKKVDSIHFKTEADFIKVYGNLDRETFYAIANRCKELGIEFMGHVPKTMSVEEVARAGMRSMEHMNNMMIAFSTAKDSLYKTLAVQQPYADFLLKTQSNEFTNSIASTLKKYDCAVVPTLIVRQGQIKAFKKQAYDLNGRDAFVPPFYFDLWNKKIPQKSPPPFVLKLLDDLDNRRIELTGLLYQKGVTILAGSDVARSNPFTYPGLSLHDEFENFVSAGISPKDVLKIATIDAAEFVKMSDSLGLVKTGYLADLLILNANPFEDVKNLKKINAVISDGNLYERQELDELLNSAKKSVATITE